MRTLYFNTCRFQLKIGIIVLFVLLSITCPAGAALPPRNLTIVGAQFVTDAYVDVGTFENKLNPLDDRGIVL